MRRLTFLTAVVAVSLVIWARSSPPRKASPSRLSPTTGASHTQATLPPRPPAPALRVLRESFGSRLEARFSSDGRLESIAGAVDRESGVNGFDPHEESQVRRRVQEILEVARGPLGLRDDWSLDKPIIRTGAVSAQAYFRETFEGVPVEPWGQVSIDLGPSGELLALYSSYRPDIKISNRIVLGEEQARVLAESAVAEHDSALGTEVGETIIWESGGIGRYAFEFNVRGRQVVIDASNGQVLSNRDQRQF